MALDGPWQFQIDPSGQRALSEIDTWRTIQVPGPWQAQFDDLRLTAGVGWYRRAVTIPAAWADQAVVLHIGAADYFCEVWVDDQPAGQHEGGYLPFACDITPFVTPGTESLIVIRVVDPGPGDGDIFPDFPFAEIPHGKQSWYGPVGGIWQPVYLEARAEAHIRQIHATPQGLDGQVSVTVSLAGLSRPAGMTLVCTTPEGELAASAAVTVEPGRPTVTLSLTIDEPLIWDLDTPHLYTLDVTLAVGGVPFDGMSARFGIRTFEARDGHLWLNGRQLYLRGALDQDYYPAGIYTPPSLDYLRQQVRQARSMGLNCLRCHIKVPDPRYLQAADEEGILVWAEVPSWGRLAGRAGERVRDTFAGMVARDWNHPSLVIWSLVNENWGTDLIHSPEDRRWLAETVDWARQLDPTRPIVDNSACFHNFHVKTDIEDFHFYAAMPEHMDRWQAFVRGFAGRSDVTFSPNGDAVRTGDEPLILSEFGNWGLPDTTLLRAAYGEADPWWFATGRQWNPAVVWPGEAEERFRQAGLEAVFRDWAGLANAAQWAQYRALKHEIEVMRAEQALSGYVITEWSDLHWECNGLVDMARHPRAFAAEFGAINADTVIVPRWERLAYWAGETARVEVLVAHHGARPLRDAVLRWSLDGGDVKGALADISSEPGRVIPVGTLAIDLPADIDRATCRELAIWLTGPDGTVLARNSLPFTALARPCDGAGNVAVWSDRAEERDWLAAQGFSLDESTGVHLATAWTDALQRHVEAGGRALVCATEASELGGLDGVAIEARQGTPRSGDWASSFAWVRPGVTRLPGGPLIDFSWRGVFPEHVITGLAPAATMAGLFVGWVHLPAALAGTLALGQGELLITTFPVWPADDSPVRTVLLHDLIRIAAQGT